MLRKTFTLGLITMLFATSMVAMYSYLPDYLSRKMNKHLSKVFSKEVVSVEIPVIDTAMINHQLFKVVELDSVVGYSMISRALGCKIGGCDNPNTDSQSFEQFFFMTAFDAHKNIKKVRVLEYTANHGYQIANKGWLKQFEKGEKFEVGKNIDGISGATISVKSITQGINNQIKVLKESL
ncbi:MAG: FMN-binding protein [Bacteroidia bacterium]|nr:FMN-binding protein [Bacteroidia bacterium]NNJ56471.1 FMN-binding protein [Bacteroidia bacterium]